MMDRASFVREFSAELSNGAGALFVGAGISKPSNVPTWADVIRPLAASRLGLVDLRDADLIQVAQYIVNASAGNRGPLIHRLRTQFSGPFSVNAYHRAIIQTQVSTVWTTNYDVLLEQAFRQGNFSVDVKATDDAISRSVPNHEIEIIKMHGSIDQSPHEDLVIAGEDYEDFDTRRPATSERLRSDLLGKSFLFLGYSYRDPNIHGIVAQARRLANKATRQHFLGLPRSNQWKAIKSANLNLANGWQNCGEIIFVALELRQFSCQAIRSWKPFSSRLPRSHGVQPSMLSAPIWTQTMVKPKNWEEVSLSERSSWWMGSQKVSVAKLSQHSSKKELRGSVTSTST
jgi:hypothetical protein